MPLVDVELIKNFTGGDESLMQLHIHTFLEYAPRQVEQFRKHLSESRWQDLSNMAHQLRPKLAYMGIRSILPAIETIEYSARDEKELDRLPELVSAVTTAIEEAMRELKEMVK